MQRAASLRVIALLGCLALQAGFPHAAAPQPASSQESGYAGKSLQDALLDLRSRGLRIVFTSEVVRPGMVVAAEPVATEPRQVLDELLGRFGLEVRDGPRDTLVVVRQAMTADEPVATSLRGSVRSRAGSGPVVGALIRVVETGAEATSAADGSFRIAEHPPGTFTLEVGRVGFAIERVEAVTVATGAPTEVAIVLDPAPIVEQVVVTPSRVSLLRERPRATIGLSRDEILALPHLGDDFFRAVSLLPGVSANDVSAQFNVRGGRRDETQILLDGQELYEAYHLKDFDSALSFVASSNLASADLSTGGFSAVYGDRMSGVLDMTTVTPTGRPRGRVGVSVLSLQAGGAGGVRDDRGSWLVEARRGTIDLAQKLLGNEDPQYGDAYAKLDYQLDDRNGLRFNLLFSTDDFDFEELLEDESKRTDTTYRSAYFWLTHRVTLSSKLLLETAVSRTGIDQDRRGVEIQEGVEFGVRDERDTEVLGLRQGWTFQASPRHFLRWGFELRKFDTRYDYFTTFAFDDPLAEIRDAPTEGMTVFRGRFEEEHESVFLADRVQVVEPLTLELGLRYDRHSLTDESFGSPRLNLAWSPTESSVFRVAWGRFTQSQRPYELQVEDGETRFWPTERSEHRVLGFERVFARDSQRGGVALRAEIYRREVRNPRPRYENLYEALNTFPEVEPDRVRIAPGRSVAEGFELFLQGRTGERLGWWVNYAWASTEDEISGEDVRRGIDQAHTLNFDLDYRVGPHWQLNLAWRYHSGWPTTPLSLEQALDDQGNTVFVPVLGPLNSERLPDYHRLDARASREFRVGGGELVFFVDVQNVYNRNNTAGFDIKIDETAGTILFEEEPWAGVLPSVGITYEF